MRKRTFGQGIISVFLFMISLTMILPFFYLLATSLSSRYFVETNQVTLWPMGFTLDSYQKVLQDGSLWKSFAVTIFTACFGTVLSVAVTSMMGYSLSRREFAPTRFLMLFVLFTMVFQAPVIPFFLTVKALRLLDSVWALILPLTVDAFNLIIVRTFFLDTPESLIESAKIDGCGDLRILFRIVMPISKPVLATVGLFYAVSYWNIFYNALLFIHDKNLQPLQILVRSFQTNSADTMASYANVDYNETTLQMATVFVVILPVLLVYPFLQKYFVAGVTLGAVKE